jgi:hypothetical protein
MSPRTLMALAVIVLAANVAGLIWVLVLWKAGLIH